MMQIPGAAARPTMPGPTDGTNARRGSRVVPDGQAAAALGSSRGGGGPYRPGRAPLRLGSSRRPRPGLGAAVVGPAPPPLAPRHHRERVWRFALSAHGHELLPMLCPWCGAHEDCHDNIDPAAMPTADDISVCWGCKRIGVYETTATGELTLRRATADEAREFREHPHFVAVMQAVHEAPTAEEAVGMFRGGGAA